MVVFYSKSNRLSLSLFTVNPVALVTHPYLRAGFQQCQSFVEMGTVRCCPLKSITLSHVDCAPGAGAEDCITRSPRLWRSNTQLVGRPRRRPTRRRASPDPISAQTVAGWSVWADILLDVIGGGSITLRELMMGTPGLACAWAQGMRTGAIQT